MSKKVGCRRLLRTIKRIIINQRVPHETKTSPERIFNPLSCQLSCQVSRQLSQQGQLGLCDCR